MKTIYVKPLFTDKEKEDARFVKHLPVSEDADLIYKGDESIKVIREDTGEILLVLLRNSLPKDLTAIYYKNLIEGKAIKKTLNRATASGLDAEKSVKADGTISNTAKPEYAVESSIIGYFDRYPRNNYCRKTSFTHENPRNWSKMIPYFQKVDQLYSEFAPKEYAEQKTIADVTSPDFKIDGTLFTTVTVNRNFRTAYHRDAGNLNEGVACMSFIRTGKFFGGDVIFPNFRIGVTLRNYDLIIFDNIEIHGNTEIKTFGSDKYERITSVFFYRKNMIFCGTAEDELDRAKRNKGDQIIGPVTEDLNKWNK